MVDVELYDVLVDDTEILIDPIPMEEDKIVIAEKAENIPSVQKQFKEHFIKEYEIKEKFKEHSVKNVVLLAAISAPEKYETLEKIYEKTNINEIENAIHMGDMKIGNMKVGKQNHRKNIKAKNNCKHKKN